MLVRDEVTGEVREKLVHDSDVAAHMLVGVLELDANLRQLAKRGIISQNELEKLSGKIYRPSCIEGLWYKFANNFAKANEALDQCHDDLCWICAGERLLSEDHAREFFKDPELFEQMLEQFSSISQDTTSIKTQKDSFTSP